MTRRPAIALALLAIAVGATLLHYHLRQQRANEDFPDGTYWVCRTCGHGFTRSLDQLAAWYRDHSGPLPCPACGKTNVVRGYHCPHPDCGAYFTNALNLGPKPLCPKCRREF
jgi:hypothetical protein